jgi:hypothetical protein
MALETGQYIHSKHWDFDASKLPATVTSSQSLRKYLGLTGGSRLCQGWNGG